MHVNTGYQREALPLVRHYVEVVRRRYDAVVAPSGSCVGSVRHQHADVAAPVGDAPLAARPSAVAARTYELSELLVDVLGVDRRRRVLPAPGHLPPDLPLAADAAGRRQAAAAAARRCAGIDLVELPDAESVLRLRRHVRAEERRHLDRDAGRQDAPRAATPAPRSCTAGDRSCLMHIGGGLSRLRAGRPHRCTWPRSWPATGASRRRDARSSACRRAPRGVGHLRGDEPFPAAARDGAGRRPAAAQPRPRHRARSGPSGPRWSARCPTGRSCAPPARRSRTTSWPACDELPGAAGGSRSPRAAATVHWARDADRGQPRSSPSWSAATGADEVVKVKSMATQEIGLNEALAGGRDRARSRPTWPS